MVLRRRFEPISANPEADLGSVSRKRDRVMRLGVNIDHVATVRNARGSAYPDPLRAARKGKTPLSAAKSAKGAVVEQLADIMLQSIA